jgi:hypothetical protein
MRYRFGRLVLVFAAVIAAPLGAQNVFTPRAGDSARVEMTGVRALDVAEVIRAQNAVGAAASAPQVSDHVARPGDTLVLGASVVGLRAGVHLRATARPVAPNAQTTHANLGQSRAMMVVGVAALITGAIIGDTPGRIIMVGGAVVGLLGLYDYLQ